MTFEQLLRTEPWQWPATAGATLLAVARDGDRPLPERLVAIEGLGEGVLEADEVAEPLLALAQAVEQPLEVRRSAVISLGPLLEAEDDVPEPLLKKIRRQMRQMFEDQKQPVPLRRQALETAVRSPQKWQVAAITQGYSSTDPEWRLTAVFCMRFVKGFKAQILECLESPDAAIRRHAVLAAGNGGYKEAWPLVAPLATGKDVDKELRLAAIEAIATIRPKKASPILLKLSEHQDQDIAEAAEDALGFIGEDDFF